MLRLPANRFAPLEQLEQELESCRAVLKGARENENPEQIRSATACVTRAAMLANRARTLKGNTFIERQMQGIRIGDIAFISVQDEPFVEIGKRIVAESPLPHTLFSGYSNGNFGYLPTRDAFSEGGYEVWASLYSPEAADLVVEAAVRMLRELAAD
jgi:hypothetical protein